MDPPTDGRHSKGESERVLQTFTLLEPSDDAPDQHTSMEPNTVTSSDTAEGGTNNVGNASQDETNPVKYPHGWRLWVLTAA